MSSVAHREPPVHVPLGANFSRIVIPEVNFRAEYFQVCRAHGAYIPSPADAPV